MSVRAPARAAVVMNAKPVNATEDTYSIDEQTNAGPLTLEQRTIEAAKKGKATKYAWLVVALALAARSSH